MYWQKPDILEIYSETLLSELKLSNDIFKVDMRLLGERTLCLEDLM